MSIYRGPRRGLMEAREDAAPLNWRRGFFRIWLLLSAAWIMGWSIYLLMFAIQEGMKTPGDVMVIPIVLFGPPVALLLFGLAAGWAFRGFKADEGPPAAPRE